MRAGLSELESAYIEVTSRCNLRCAMCPRTYFYGDRGVDMHPDDFERVLGQMPGLRRAVLHGLGEPLLHPHLPRLIRRLKAAGIAAVFNSNATLLTPRLQEELIQAQLDEYRVSLDGATPALYARIRGAPLLERALDNLRALMSRRREVGSTVPRVSLWCVAMTENLDQLPNLVRLAGELTIDEVYVQRLVYFGRGLAVEEQSLYRRLAAREEELLQACERLAGEMGISFTASGSTRPVESLGSYASRVGQRRRRGVRAGASHAAVESDGAGVRPWQSCRRPWSSTYVTVEGDVLPCCFVPFVARGSLQPFVMGNALRDRFDAIWCGPRYQAFRQRFLSGEPPSCCEGCGVRWSI